MKKAIYLALAILMGCFLLGPWAWAEEKKEEAGAKVPKLLFKTDVGENIVDFKQLEHGEKVAIATANKLFVYDKKGILQWQKNFENPLQKYYVQVINGWVDKYITILDEGKILVHTNDTLYLLNERGREEWNYRPGQLIENYSLSEDGKLLAIVYLDNNSYFQMELIKIDEHNVKSLWKYKMTDVQIDIAAYEMLEPTIINIAAEDKYIILDGTPGFIAFFDRAGNLLKRVNYFSSNDKTRPKTISSYSKKAQVFTVVSNDTLKQYDISGNELLSFKLPAKETIGEDDSVYYFETEKVFYLNLVRLPLFNTYLLDKQGGVLTSKQNDLYFGEMIPLESYLIGAKDSTDTVASYDISNKRFLWTVKKPRGLSRSLLVDKENNYVVLGSNNGNRNIDMPTLLIYNLKDGSLLWQAALGIRSSVSAQGRLISKYLAVLSDNKNFYYYDLKPILPEGDDHATK